YGTNPTSRDTDGDGISDSEEIFDYGTNPIRETNIDESLARKPVKLNVQDGTYYKSMNSVFTGVAPYGARVRIYTQDDRGVRQLIGETVAGKNNKFLLSPEILPQGKYNVIVQTLIPKDQAEKFENTKTLAEKRKNESLQRTSSESDVSVLVTDKYIFVKFADVYDLNSAKKFVNIKYQSENQKYVPYVAGLKNYIEYFEETEGMDLTEDDQIRQMKELEQKIDAKDKDTLDELRSLMVIPYRDTLTEEGRYRIEIMNGLKSINGKLITPASFNSWFDIENEDIISNLLKASVLEAEKGYISYETEPIEINVDNNTDISEPDPKKLSDIELTTDHILKGVKVTVTNNRPIIEGVFMSGDYEVKVVAHWKSLLLTSALIADTSKGDFRIYAPEDLEGGEHQVYLYAVKKDDLRTLRSKDVIINFEIPNGEMPLWIWLAIAAGIIAVMLAYFLFREKDKHPMTPTI
ncbi:thrombospondin type 3 repeat-containing protein, partial [Patescibacteria group bacterium]|nr:thrombospondin type 3 repeat-containing protein [Patescibacteria group bacterium]